MDFDPTLLSQLDPAKLPRHLAFVMDGNGRWAQQRHLPRNFGHREGVKSVDVDYASKTAEVAFDDTVTDVNKVAAASTNAGYPATPQ